MIDFHQLSLDLAELVRRGDIVAIPDSTGEVGFYAIECTTPEMQEMSVSAEKLRADLDRSSAAAWN